LKENVIAAILICFIGFCDNRSSVYTFLHLSEIHMSQEQGFDINPISNKKELEESISVYSGFSAVGK
jgi:hypothetical protein